MARRFTVVCGGLVAWTGALAACAVQPIEVGKQDVQPLPEAGVDAAVEATPPLTDAATLESVLRAKCSAPEGVRDEYTSGATLSARLLRSWFFCGAEGTSPLPAGIGIAMDAQGSYALLRWNRAHDGFVASTDPDERGTVRYQAFSDIDAGAGADAGKSSRVIALDDPSPNKGLFVYLSRATVTDLSFVADFDKSPPRLILSEAGPSSSSGVFVPID